MGVLDEIKAISAPSWGWAWAWAELGNIIINTDITIYTDTIIDTDIFIFTDIIIDTDIIKYTVAKGKLGEARVGTQFCRK